MDTEKKDVKVAAPVAAPAAPAAAPKAEVKKAAAKKPAAKKAAAPAKKVVDGQLVIETANGTFNAAGAQVK